MRSRSGLLACLAVSSSLALLAGCPSQSYGGDDTYLPPGGQGAGCKHDTDCAPDVCARDGECLPAEDVRSIRVSWTIEGMPANATTCMTQPDFYLQFNGDYNDGVGFAPVPCMEGQFFVDKMPSRFTYVEVGIDNGGALNSGTFDADGNASFDLQL